MHPLRSDHPLFSAYIEARWEGRATKDEIKQDMKIFERSLEDRLWCMSVSWHQIWKAGQTLNYDFDLGNACHKAYDNGWEHDEETRKLKQLFQQLVCPQPLDKKLEDYL